ncbi:hypothetical protein KKA24_01690 [Patescibacteria group bacterium]|nr:hypothetical protein [Patescibacteria group bacterium]
MDKNNYFYNKDRDDIYHPFSDYNEDKYLPEESLTKQLVLIRLIWDDILCLSEIYKEQKDSHKRKAILKYIVMDMCSLYDKFQEFKNLVVKDKSIKCEQKEEILRKFNSFLLKLENFSKGSNDIPAGKYRGVRNKLSAHRDRDIPLSKVKIMWDNLDYKDIENISKEITHFFDYLKGLRIYQWAKFNKNNTIEIVNESSFVEIVEKK